MTSMVDPAGNQWSWGFDVLGRQTSAIDPDSGTTTTTYDAGGNVLTTTDARGVVLAYSYDALNRKTGEYLNSAGSSGSIQDSWVYDTLAKGQMTSSTSYVGSTPGNPGLAYTSSVTGYDAGYRPSGTTTSIPTGAPAFAGTSYTNSMTYYAGGVRSSISYPAEGGLSAERLRTSYDGIANLASMAGTNSYVLASYTAIGQPGQYARNGTTSLFTSYGYDIAAGAVADIQQTAGTGVTSTSLGDAVYSYDNAGQVTSIATSSNTTAADTQCFEYDHLQDLTSAWTPADNNCATARSSGNLGGPAPYWIDYSVDAATGNRLSMTENPVTTGGFLRRTRMRIRRLRQLIRMRCSRSHMRVVRPELTRICMTPLGIPRLVRGRL